MLSVRSIRTIDEMYAISGIWRRLQEDNPHVSIPDSWIWNVTWCEQVLPRRRKARLDIKLLEDEAGTPVAICPLFTEAAAGPMLRFSRFIGFRLPGRHDILLSEPRNPELVRNVVAALRSNMDWRTIAVLRPLREGSLFTQELLQQGLAHLMVSQLSVTADPRITDQYQRLGRSRRSTCRRHFNKLQRAFGIEFEVCGGPGMANAFEEHMRLHELRWQGRPEQSLIQHENRDFLKAVTRRLSDEGQCEIILLRAGGRPIASIVMLVESDSYYFMQSGFDPEFSGYSPMRILITEAMRRGFDELGREVFDLGLGYDDYKMDWRPKVSGCYFGCFAGRSLYARAMAMAFRAVIAGRRSGIRVEDGAASGSSRHVENSADSHD